MKKTVIRFLVLAALLTMIGAGTVNASVVTFEPFNPTVLQGESFHIYIVGKDFPATMGGETLVQWDSGLLSLTSTTFTWTGDTLPPGGAPSGAGWVNLSVGNFSGTNPSGNFGIADLLFTATNIGSSLLTITTSDWYDAAMSPFNPQPTGLGGTITVSAVPIPAAVWLLGSGLVGLIGLRRRMKK